MTPTARGASASPGRVARRTATPVLSGLSRPGPRALTTAAALAAAVLAATSTGSLVVAALLVGLATSDRRSGAAVLLAATAASIRFGTASLDDLAGIQSVLGPAVAVGPETAAASAWCAGAAVLLATRVPDVEAAGRRPWRFAPPLATGLLAAALAAGPGPADLGLRAGASVIAIVLATAVTLPDRWRWVLRVRMWLAVAVAVAACVLAGWPA